MKTVGLDLVVAVIQIKGPGFVPAEQPIHARDLAPWAYEQLVAAKALYDFVAAQHPGPKTASSIVRRAVRDSKVDR